MNIVRRENDGHKEDKYFCERADGPWRSVFPYHAQSFKCVTHEAEDGKLKERHN